MPVDCGQDGGRAIKKRPIRLYSSAMAPFQFAPRQMKQQQQNFAGAKCQKKVRIQTYLVQQPGEIAFKILVRYLCTMIVAFDGKSASELRTQFPSRGKDGHFVPNHAACRVCPACFYRSRGTVLAFIFASWPKCS